MNYNDQTFYTGNDPQSQFNGQPNPVVENSNLDNYPAMEKRSDNLGLKIAAAVGGAAVLGTGAVLAYNHFSDSDNGTGDALGTAINPATDSNGIPEAHSVNDNMTYQEAFDAARAEVGSGGCFVWHGGVYGTYTRTEWNAMSPAEQAEFTHNAMGEHSPEGYVAQQHNTVNNTTHVYTEEHRVVNHGPKDDDLSDDSRPASRNSESGRQHEADTAHNAGRAAGGSHAPSAHDTGNHTSDSGVHFLGVSEEEYNGSMVTVGHATIDGKPAILVDGDHDGVFDYMAYDRDGSGDLQEGEVQPLPQDEANCIRVSEFEQACIEENGGNDDLYPDGNDDGGVHLIGLSEEVDEDGNPITVGLLRVDDHEGMIVDVDHDGYFDVMAVDADDNGEISDREVMVLNEPIAVQDFGDVEIYGEGGDSEPIDAIDATYDSDLLAGKDSMFDGEEPVEYEEPAIGIEVDLDSHDAIGTTAGVVYDDQGNIVKDADVQVDHTTPDDEGYVIVEPDVVQEHDGVEVIHDENEGVGAYVEVEAEADVDVVEPTPVAYEEPSVAADVEPEAYTVPETYEAPTYDDTPAADTYSDDNFVEV